MPLELEPLAILGRRYAEVRERVDGVPPQRVFDEVDEGEPEELYVEASDGRWQCTLDAAGAVESIFLFGDKGCQFPFGLTAGMSQAEVLTCVREAPARSKPERTVPGMGWAGAFLRWDRPEYCLHAEFDRNGGLRQLTFMTAKRAP